MNLEEKIDIVKDILKDKNFTCYPDEELINMVSASQYVDRPVVVSGNVITSQSPHSSMAYALTIAKELGYDISEVQKAIKGCL